MILLIWFYYSQKQILSKNYYREINGIYAGFTKPIYKSLNDSGVNSGIIMNIRDIDNQGYFKGEFDFGETEIKNQDNRVVYNNKIDGIHTFFGELRYKINRDKKRHPFKPKENRIYSGKLYIVDRLDFQFEKYKIEDYLSAEYSIIHYREMQTIIFTLIKKYKKKRLNLPETFTLYKSVGFNFEPYKSLKTIVFNKTRADN